ncbi:MAG: insulinase family protein [Myxococcales bacterium]|nr:insulinase family protein [Myxococcales bacterium]
MITTLENGLRVVVVENHAAPVVALQMWVNTGSADDPAAHAGLAHVLEHMVFKGTQRRGVGQIAREVEGAGGDINAWTSFDQTVYHLVLASRFFDRGLDVIADMTRNTVVDATELARELDVVLEEIKEGDDSPAKVSSREMFTNAFKKHPYGRPVIGFARNVKALDQKTVKRFFAERYSPTNMTLVIVGDLDRHKAMRRIERTFGSRFATAGAKVAPRLKASPRPAEPTQRNVRVVATDQASQETHISIAFHVPEFVHADTPLVDLAAMILGHGNTSRLVRSVRHEKQLVTDIYAYAYTPRDPGLLIIGAMTSHDKAQAAIRAIADEVFALTRYTVSSAELSRAQTLIESDTVYQKETVQGLARKIGFYAAVAGDLSFEDEYQRRVAGATPRAMREVVARYFKPGNMTISIVSPKASALVARAKEDVIAAAARLEKRKASKSAEGKLVKVTLPNGARLVMLRDTTVPLVAMRAVWRGGLRFESAGNNGINNLIAALATRGTATQSAEQIHGAVESMAGAIGGFSGRNSFGLRAEMLSRHWERGMEVLADCARDPAFAPKELERARRETLEDLRAQQDNLSSVAMQRFSEALYTRHPYRMNVLGTPKTVRALSRKQLMSYYRRHFPVGEMVLAVIGDIDPDKVSKKFEQLFGAVRGKKASAPRVPQEPARKKPAQVFESSNKAQAHVVVGYPGTTLTAKDRVPLEVLLAILAGQSGRLFTELREKRGLAYRVTAFSLEGLEPGYIAAYMATSPDNIQAAIDGFEREFERLRKSKVGAAELKRIKRYLAGSHEISLQRRSTLAAYVALDEVYGLGYRTYLEYADKVMKVTAEDIRRVARKYLDNGKRVISIVHPDKLSPGAEKALGALRPVGTAKKRAKKTARGRKK